jgi:hypothetical protein
MSALRAFRENVRYPRTVIVMACVLAFLAADVLASDAAAQLSSPQCCKYSEECAEPFICQYVGGGCPEGTCLPWPGAR